MRILPKCCATIALYTLVLPLGAQEDADTVDLYEQVALAPHALAVLPIGILTIDPRAPALAAEAYEAILNQLAAIEGLYVIGRESVLPYAVRLCRLWRLRVNSVSAVSSKATSEQSP